MKTMKPLDAMKKDANIPNIPVQLQIKNIVSDQDVMIETEVLDPITSNQHYSKFILPNKGVLDAKNSRLVWSATNEATNGSVCRPTNVVGGLGLIKSIKLSIGGNEVSFIDDLNQYSVCKKQFKSLDTQKFRGEPFIKNNNDIIYADEGGGNRWFMPTNIGNNNQGAVVGKSLTNNPQTTPKYAESLTDLLPFFSKGNQYPLFLSRQEVVMEIEWDTSPEGLIFDDATKTTIPVIQTPTLMLDLMFYGEDVLDLLKENNAKQGLNFDYNDVMLIKSNIANGTNSKNFFLGMANRTIDRVWIQNDDKGKDEVGMGKFRSVVDNGSEWNVRINENMLYEKNIDQRGMEYSYMCETVKKPFNTVLGEYQGGTNTYCGNGNANREVESLSNLTTNTKQYVIGANIATPFDNITLPAVVFNGGDVVASGTDATAELQVGEIGFMVGEEIPVATEGDAITANGTVELDNAEGGGAGTAPTFTLTVAGGKLTKIVVATAGSGGYTDLPTLKYSGGTATTPPTIGAVSNAMMGALPNTAPQLLTKGSGYTTTPTIALNPADAGTAGITATLSADLNDQQTQINVETCLKGTMNYQGIDFTTYNNQDGTNVGAVPVEYILNRTAGGDRLKRFWVSYSKSFGMLNGQVQIDQR